jgi:hypothetical protein
MGFLEDVLVEQDLAGAKRLIESAIIPQLSEPEDPTALYEVADQHSNHDFIIGVGPYRYPIEVKRDTFQNNRIVIEMFGAIDLDEGEKQTARIIETYSMERSVWDRRIWQLQGKQWFDMLRGKPGLIFDENLPENHLLLYRKANDNKGAWYLFDSRKLTTYLRARYREYRYCISDNSNSSRPYYTLSVLLDAADIVCTPELKDTLICQGVDPQALLAVPQLARVPFQCDED